MPGRSKKSSHRALTGTRRRLLPSLMTRSSFTSSGKAAALGRRTACERFDLKTVAFSGGLMSSLSARLTYMSMGYAEIPIPRLGQHPVQPHVVRLQAQRLDRLSRIGEADPDHLGPRRKGAVVKPAALPQPSADRIERQQWRQDQIRLQHL